MSWLKPVVTAEPTTYRVVIMPGAVKVELVGVGSMSIPGNNRMEEGWFNSVDDLPQWAQERLSMLMMCVTDKGRDKRNDVPGIGRIISSDIFWIYA